MQATTYLSVADELPGVLSGELAPEPRITAIVPAHNEADGIIPMVRSLAQQTVRPDKILVVADNCTDATAGKVSQLMGEHCPVSLAVLHTINNRHMKAGALNQAMDYVFRSAFDQDVLVVMDADSVLDRRWIESALEAMPEESQVKAVSGMCRGDPGQRGVLATLQRMEYEQIAAQRTRKGGATRMLSGAGSAFRAGTLREVADSRGSRLPGRHGDVYDQDSLTEDHELTLAIRSLGWQITSPRGCGVRTELVTTWRALADQRLRWDRGGLADVRTYGLNRVTFAHVGYLAERALGVLVHVLVAALVTLALASGAALTFSWWALGFALLAGTPAIVGVRRMGWRYMLIAGAIIPQFAYYLYLEAVGVKAYWKTLTRRSAEWKH